MGQIISIFRIAVEMEKWRSKTFRKELDKSERKSFDEMLSYSRSYTAQTDGLQVCVVTSPILFSIIFQHYKEFTNIGIEQE